jgi:predicted nuclease with TOPRIM domain
VTDNMADTISELKQRLREQAEKVASMQQLREQLANARRRVAEMEPLAIEIDDLRVEALQAKSMVRDLQKKLSDEAAESEETIGGLQGQLRLLRGSLAEAAVCAPTGMTSLCHYYTTYHRECNTDLLGAGTS